MKRWVQPKCQCQVDNLMAETRMIQKASEDSERRSLYSISNLGSKYLNASFENMQVRPGMEDVFDKCRRYTNKFDQLGYMSLMIWGDYGNGKTMLAAAIHNKLTSEGKNIVFITLPDLLDKIKSTFNRDNKDTEERIMKALISCDLLILDDIGAEKTSDWVQEKLFTIIDGRYTRQKPILVTSNLKPNELYLQIGKRSYDRLIEMSQPIENKASSYRREIAKNRMSEFDKLLGD